MFSTLDIWDDRSARSAAGQMACDEAILLGAVNPTLRVYRWDSPAVTFGYAQRLAEVRQRTGSLPVIRRWTGGGIVFHGEDLTLALAVPVGFDLVREKPGEIYRRLHGALLPALAAYFPDVRLALPGDCLAGPACFEAPALHDIISGGVKICGGALRRGRHGVLYQGSIQNGANLRRVWNVGRPSRLPACGGNSRRDARSTSVKLAPFGSIHTAETDCAMEIARALSPVIRVIEHTTPFDERAALLETERYGTAGWNAMR